MQMETTIELRRVWKAHGSPPCEHPNYEREYFLSSGTGDYVCTTCGAYVDPAEITKRSKSK
jgi:hypothetical protein